MLEKFEPKLSVDEFLLVINAYSKEVLCLRWNEHH